MIKLEGRQVIGQQMPLGAAPLGPADIAIIRRAQGIGERPRLDTDDRHDREECNRNAPNPVLAFHHLRRRLHEDRIAIGM